MTNAPFSTESGALHVKDAVNYTPKANSFAIFIFLYSYRHIRIKTNGLHIIPLLKYIFEYKIPVNCKCKLDT